MTLAADYRRQRAWRNWPAIFDALPSVQGQLVLDLGCGVGDQAAELVALGADVIGIDGNEELLSEARSLSLPNAQFRQHDLGALPDLDVSVEGLWCSFVAAYFPDLPAVLRGWTRHLVSGGWIALTEVDDLFGHEPLSAEARAIFDAYAREAFAAKRYDFHMGHKLKGYLRRCGFSVSREFTLEDSELSFAGAASSDVIEAWRARLDRLKLLHTAAGAGFEGLREEFIACLASANHRSTAKVYCCIATKGEARHLLGD